MLNKLNNIIVLGIVIVACVSHSAYAKDYYDEHAVGWHWYDDPKEEDVKKALQKPIEKTNDPNVVVSNAKKRITTALNTMIAEPTVQNAERYIALQEELNNRAEKVADVWQQALLKNPSLNYSLSHPTNNIALQVYHEKESIEKEVVIQAFAKKAGLFFFYRSTCHYCQRFAPILKNFAERNGMAIIPITLDGISLPEFPNSKTDSGQAIQFQVKATPAVFAVNPTTGKAFPIAYGLTSETELRDNIYNIVKRYEGGKL